MTAKKPAKKNRTWVVSLIRKHGQFLGYVEAPDGESAEARAVERSSANEWRTDGRRSQTACCSSERKPQTIHL
jgi:hypothetical protein